MTAPILVTGGTGQLATALAEAAPARGLAVESRRAPECWISTGPAASREVFAASAPPLVVNAAAYTAVDAAEDDADGGVPGQSRRAGGNWRGCARRPAFR